MSISPDLLVKLGVAPKTAPDWAPHLASACAEFQINTPRRVAALLSQVLHESARLRFLSEVWGPTVAQREYEPPHRRAAGLGNDRPGDGFKFRGHGPIQTTGRSNHRRVTAALRARGIQDCPDFEVQPDLLCMPRWGSFAAGLYWNDNKINPWADKGDIDNVSSLVNCGRTGAKANHAAERRNLYQSALAALGE
jgi:putative chitinase